MSLTHQADPRRKLSVSNNDSNNSHRDVPAVEFRRRWQQGERSRVEDFLQEFPVICEQPEVVLDVIYEEYLQRQEDGDDNAEQDLLQRFPQWREPLQLMIECHHLLHSSAPVPDFPDIDDWLGEFRLLAELGRGARGRVCLAAQTDLADRLVVLKLTPLNGVEHLSLARLQHTNIVPVYSVTNDSDRRLRVLVMPYFGRATLATLMTSLADVPLANRCGEHLVAALDQAQDPLFLAPVATPARQMLAHVSYTQAVCWIAASLADALQYAHDRGLVHSDVKPSNVLLAHDGQPMLLDFHLACEPVRHDGPIPDHFGGTPEYMPPEQRQAMSALRDGIPIETDVDARADIFSLGAIIYELLGGRLPLDANSPPLARISPWVSLGLSDIVTKCLSPCPDNRYVSASALADDLRRHLADQPLTGVGNRSMPERWHKWRRRQPNTMRIAGMAAIVALTLVIGAASTWSQFMQRTREAEQWLLDARGQLRSSQPRDAVTSLERGVSLLQSIPFRGQLAHQLRDELVAARRQVLIAELHQLADQLRVLSGTELPTDRSQRLADLCRQFWDQRQQIATRLSASESFDVTVDLLDVAIFWANLQRRLGTTDESGRDHSLRTLAEAEELFGSSRVLDYERGLRTDKRGMETPARTLDQDRQAEIPNRLTVWEHYAVGRALFNEQRFSEAARELDAARTLAPSDAWPNFYFGLCAQRLGRHDEAVAAFSVCIGAAPKLAGCFYNRALSLMALQQFDPALRDYNRALELDTAFAAAWLNRAMLHFERNNLAAAEADLCQARQHGADPAMVTHNFELIQQRRSMR